jgi:predicted phage terminase large subunit-like protein
MIYGDPKHKDMTLEEREAVKAKNRIKKLTNAQFKKIMLYRCKTELPVFAKMVLGEHVPLESPEFHRELFDLYKNNHQLAIAAPRGHAKSTTTDLIYALFVLLNGYRKFVIICSSSEDTAMRFLRTLKDELEVNDKLRWMYGDQRSDKWTSSEIKLANGAVVLARGRGSQMRGLKEGAQRPDLIILDDIEDEEMVRSETRRQDLEEWFNGSVKPSLAPDGQIIFIGTILHQDSLLARCLDPALYPEFVTRRYAIVKDNGDPLWPARWSIDGIQALKADYTGRGLLHNFYMEYMNDPIPKENAEFKIERFEYYDSDSLPTDLRVYAGMDPSGGTVGKTSDKTAIVVVGVDDKSNYYVLDIYNELTTSDEMIRLMMKVQERWKPRKFGIEKMMATRMLMPHLEKAMRDEGLYLPMELMSADRGAGGRKGMSDGKYQRIKSLVGPANLGILKFNRKHVDLFEQMATFPRGKHDDVLDALSYAWRLAEPRSRTKINIMQPTRLNYLKR